MRRLERSESPIINIKPLITISNFLAEALTPFDTLLVSHLFSGHVNEVKSLYFETMSVLEQMQIISNQLARPPSEGSISSS